MEVDTQPYNVADETTRACSKVDISPTSRWLLGPSFLKLSESNWSKELTTSNWLDQDEEEIKIKNCCLR